MVEERMASFCCLSTTASTSKTLAIVSPSVGAGHRQSPSMSQSCSCSPVSAPLFGFNPLLTYNRRPQLHVVRMAPEEEKKTRRNPLDFPLVCSSLDISSINALFVRIFGCLLSIYCRYLFSSNILAILICIIITLGL